MIDTDGEPLRLAVRAEPDVVSPNEARGRGAGRSRVQRRSTIARRRSSRSTRLGAGEAIMTVRRRLLRAGARGRHAGALPGPRRRAVEPRSSDRVRAMPSSPAMSPPATAARRRSSACASGSRAGRSRPSTSAPGSSSPARVERLLGEVEGRAARARGRDRLTVRPPSAPPGLFPGRKRERLRSADRGPLLGSVGPMVCAPTVTSSTCDPSVRDLRSS